MAFNHLLGTVGRYKSNATVDKAGTKNLLVNGKGLWQ